MAKALAQFSIKRSGEDYLLTFEDSNGETMELTADYDQLDLLTETIEDTLNSDEEEALEPDEDEVEEEPEE